MKRDPENRSKKACDCGGHNDSNPKSNTHHHGTRVKLGRRQVRRFTHFLLEGVR